MSGLTYIIIKNEEDLVIKLYGMPVSNFYCMAKQALQEKAIVFEEVYALPSQDSDYLRKSPMGKIPVLETAKGFISETNVIFDYLEAVQPSPNLYPADAFEKAKVKQLIKVVECYIEAPAHAMVGALLGLDVPEAQRLQAKPQLQSGLAALQRLAQFAPWICGSTFTYADIFSYHALGMVIGIAGTVYDWDIAADLPGLTAWRKRVAARPITQSLDAASRAAMQAFLQK
jgi:glutathione S-transferase